MISRQYRTLYCWAIFALLAVNALAHAWVADDAYITFRVVDNIVHGLGAVWNADERVQVYTHPLWMMLHIPFYALFGHIYWLTIGLSLTCFAFAVYIAIRFSKQPLIICALAFALPLALSKPIMDFAASGMETPLAMLLIAYFVALLQKSKLSWLALSFTSALLMLTRMDYAPMLIPVWCLLLCQKNNHLKMRRIGMGASPFIIWCIFSIFYYGFLFPNTKYAKLNTGIPQSELFNQGVYYLFDLWLNDTLSCLLLCALVGIFIVTIIRQLRYPSFRNSRNMMLALGGMIYCGYVISVGGDFMSGRFWAAPIFLSLILLLHYLPAQKVSTRTGLLWVVWLLIIFQFSNWQRQQLHNTGCASTETEAYNADTNSICAFQGITDERQFYLDNTGLFSSTDSWIRGEPTGKFVAIGKALHDHPEEIYPLKSIGITGYYAGPRVTIIDVWSLADPLLARLPMANAPWRIGHFLRDLPEGYSNAGRNGHLTTMDTDLAYYYGKLRMVTMDPLWSREHLQAVWDFQSGNVDKWRNNYVIRHCSDFYAGCNSN